MNASLLIAAGLTIGISALCSILEAMILSTTVAEIESLKNRKPYVGNLLEKFKNEIEETSSAILSLNTIANTLGATVVGGMAVNAFQQYDSERVLTYASVTMCVSVLVFSEIIPKNVGVLYRSSLQQYLVFPLWGIRIMMTPVSRLCKVAIKLIVPEKEEEENSDEEIILLAEKSAKDGTLSTNERDLISNALRLDEMSVKDIMTPRTVVTALEVGLTIDEVFQSFKNIPFARIPVYKENIDNIIGIVRRRELLAARADDLDDQKLEGMYSEALFIPETSNASSALQQFLKKNQQLGIVVDEFGSVTGVVSMEDVIEYLLGQEIFEEDDPAIDMRELAKKKQVAAKRRLSKRQKSVA